MIAVVDYGMGNLGSIVNMLRKVGAEAVISDDREVVSRAQKLILPGVGAFDGGMRNLTERGLVPLLNAKAVNGKTPLLGICLGMQLLCSRSEEGVLPGLGWLDADVVRFRHREEERDLKIPHMGWNEVAVRQKHPLLQGLADDNRFYFVHSYHVVCRDAQNILGETNYGFPFASVVAKGNIMGVQFHPEKSHRFGLQLLRNFVERV